MTANPSACYRWLRAGAILAVCVALAACDEDKRPVDLGTAATDTRWQVTKLFEHEGCAAYHASGPYVSDFTYVVCDGGGQIRTEERRLIGAKPVIHKTINVDTVMRGIE